MLVVREDGDVRTVVGRLVQSDCQVYTSYDDLRGQLAESKAAPITYIVEAADMKTPTRTDI